MAEANSLNALWRSKKFGLALGWAILCVYLSSQANNQEAVTLIGWGTIGIAAYQIGQGLSEFGTRKGCG